MNRLAAKLRQLVDITSAFRDHQSNRPYDMRDSHAYQRLAAFYVARAKGEIGLILTGGYAPCPEGVMDAGGLVLNKSEQLDEHRLITSAVNNSGGRIVLQILHAGRYAKVPTCVAPSLGKARINV